MVFMSHSTSIIIIFIVIAPQSDRNHQFSSESQWQNCLCRAVCAMGLSWSPPCCRHGQRQERCTPSTEDGDGSVHQYQRSPLMPCMQRRQRQHGSAKVQQTEVRSLLRDLAASADLPPHSARFSLELLDLVHIFDVFPQMQIR